MRKESLNRENGTLQLQGEKIKNQVFLPVVLALSNLCLQPGGNSLAHFYFCSSAIVSGLFLALFPQLAGLRTSAFYGRAGEAGAVAAGFQPPTTVPGPPVPARTLGTGSTAGGSRKGGQAREGTFSSPRRSAAK